METPIASLRSSGTGFLDLHLVCLSSSSWFWPKDFVYSMYSVRFQDLIHEFQYLQSSQKHIYCKYGVMGVHCVLNYGRKHVEYMIVYINCENVWWGGHSLPFAVHFQLCLFSPTGYIGEFEIVDDHRSGKIVVNLTGRLNKCGVISPRFDVPINDIEKWTNNLLPSRQFGYVMIVLPI